MQNNTFPQWMFCTLWTLGCMYGILCRSWKTIVSLGTCCVLKTAYQQGGAVPEGERETGRQCPRWCYHSDWLGSFFCSSTTVLLTICSTFSQALSPAANPSLSANLQLSCNPSSLSATSALCCSKITFTPSHLLWIHFFSSRGHLSPCTF